MKTGLSGTEIQTILKTGRRYPGNGLVVVFGEKKEAGGRFAVVVSKNVAKTSVQRNALKRQLREAVRSLPPRSHPFVILCTEQNQSYRRMKETLRVIFEEGERLVSLG